MKTSDELIFKMAVDIVARVRPDATGGEAAALRHAVAKLITDAMLAGDFVRMERPGL